MYHHVPDFEMDEDYSIHSSSGVLRPRKSSLPDDEIMELLWENGQVVMQSQNQRSTRRSPQSKYHDAVIPAEETAAREIRSGQELAAHSQHNHNPHLFMQEDEMASWLHYPLVDDDPALDSTFCADLLYPTNNLGNTSSCDTPVHIGGIPELRQAVTAGLGASRPPIPPASRTELAESKVPNFVHFSRHKPKITEGGPDKTAPSSSRSAVVVRESTVVDSSETPSVGPTSNFGDRGFAAKSSGAAAGTSSGGGRGGGGGGGVASAKDTATCELTVTSSPGCSSTSAEAAPKQPAEDRKRKGREADDAECQSEDVECEFTDAKRQVRGSTTTRRSRAAEVHNLSERRRRDRINEKMKALQELIPRCNKSDKASMLDEAIEYLKSLQLQVQMMSMGCGMVPMMFPGVQQYMPAMGMGIGMGMGMGMEMGINRPMMPFSNVLAGSSLPTPAAVAQLGPRFPLPAFHMLPVPAPDPSRIQAANQSEQMLNSLGSQVPSQVQFPNFADPYQHYVATHQMQLPIPQNEALAQPSSGKPSTNKGPENLDNRQ